MIVPLLVKSASMNLSIDFGGEKVDAIVVMVAVHVHEGGTNYVNPSG